ncbi:MAG TPA: COX15/CtaA family protein [Myxococcota bacterium]|nr:COX15/CtaA family protein [Myxococcota bacterium]
MPAATSTLEASARRGDARALAPGFAILTGVTVCLIVLGALVRAHEAGLACPDWPLCFGEFVPAFDLRVAFEYSHRVLAGSVLLAFAALSIAAWRRGAGAGARRCIVVGAVLLGIQALLGALTVWHLLASWTVTSHLVTGNACALTLLLTAFTLRDEGVVRAPATPAARRWIPLVACVLFLQLVLGGLVSSRYAGLSCPEWPTCNGGVWFPTWHGPVGIHLMHRSNGYLLALLLCASAWMLRGDPRVGRGVRLAAALVLAQVVVGVANVRFGIPVEITALHSLLAALLVLTVGSAVRNAFIGARRA